MRTFRRLREIAGIFALGIVFLSSCTGHQSFSTMPAASAYIPPANARDRAAKTITLHVTDLDGGAEASETQTHALTIVNGSRLRIALTGGNVTSAAVEAGDSSATLQPTGEGQWTATIRYIDSSNPPVQNPILEVNMQTAAGHRTLRIPVIELHE
jgi:hypothetical protein